MSTINGFRYFDKRPQQVKKNDDATMFPKEKMYFQTNFPVYKVSKRLVKNWNNGKKHPSYMNPIYRPAQCYNKRLK